MRTSIQQRAAGPLQMQRVFLIVVQPAPVPGNTATVGSCVCGREELSGQRAGPTREPPELWARSREHLG